MEFRRKDGWSFGVLDVDVAAYDDNLFLFVRDFVEGLGDTADHGRRDAFVIRVGRSAGVLTKVVGALSAVR